MKVLAFHIGAQRFGLPLTAVEQVLPAAALVAVPGAPGHVAGLLDLHGTQVPVIDLSRLAGGEAAPVRYNTRILLVDYPLGDGNVRPLGLLAERVSGVVALAGKAITASGVVGAPWLGEVATDDHGALQLVAVAHLLTPEVCASLYPLQEADR
jgi:chemotaxis-related protein WspB